MKAFVYGALMDELDGVPAVCEGYETRFSASGVPWLEPRFLALEAVQGSRAHGILVELDEQTFQRVTAHEDGYRGEEVEVMARGERHIATALVLCPEHRVEEGRPSRRYATRLVRGAERAGLPGEVIDRYRVAQRQGSAITDHLWPIVALVRALTGRIGLPASLVLVLFVIVAMAAISILLVM